MEAELFNPIVIDCGSHTTHAAIAPGFEDYETRQVSFRTVVGRLKHCPHYCYRDNYVAEEAIEKANNLKGQLYLTYPVAGTVTNYDDYEKVLHHTFYSELRVAPEEHRLLLTDYCNELNDNKTVAQRKKITEMLFESFCVEGLYLADKSIMSTYSTGRTSGIVVDCGYRNTRINAVYEGSCIPNSSQSIDFAGYAINNHFTKLMNDSNSGFSFITTKEQDILVDIKEQHSFVSLKNNQKYESANSNNNSDSVDYKLPNGQTITINSDILFKASEPLFNPSLLKQHCDNKSIQQAIVDCYKSCPDELKEEMISNIIVVGGTSNTTNFSKRLQIELNNEFKLQNIDINNCKVNLITPKNAQLSTMNGALTYCSMQEFNDSLITRQHYDEYGPTEALIHFY